MEEYVRKLTHDNETFEKEWPSIYTAIHDLWRDTLEDDQLKCKVKSLDALVDYVLADNDNSVDIKLTFVDIVIQLFVESPLPSLNELVRIFCRILSVLDKNVLIQLNFLQKMFTLFELGEQLSEEPSVDLIDIILIDLQKYDFSNDGFTDKAKSEWIAFLSQLLFNPISSNKNKINHETTVVLMRQRFQELYRWAALHSQASDVWREVEFSLRYPHPTLFYSYLTPDDAQSHLLSCSQSSGLTNYIDLVVAGLGKDANLFEANIFHVYKAIEMLVSQGEINQARKFTDGVIVIHFNAIKDQEELVKAFIHQCSIVNIEHRNSFAYNIISLIVSQLVGKKPNKKLAELFFNFVLAIIDLHASRAPADAYSLLNIADFYPWKQLNKKIAHLVESCANYDKLTAETHDTQLGYIESILNLISDRATVNKTILAETHPIAVQSLLKWSKIIDNDTGKPYDSHVFKMGQSMVRLVDEGQLSVDIIYQFIDAIRKKLDDQDEVYDPSGLDRYFLQSIAHLVAKSLEKLTPVPDKLHQQLASYLLTALRLPFTNESGHVTYANSTAVSIWYKLWPILTTENDARFYESCADEIYKLICDEQENMTGWWYTFWAVVGNKYPNIAVDHVPQFLHDIIDRKECTLISFLSPLYPKRPEPYHARLDDIINVFIEKDAMYVGYYAVLLQEIIKMHPEIITAKHVDHLINSIKEFNEPSHNTRSMFQVLSNVANSQPDLFDKHRDYVISYVIDHQSFEAFECLQQYLIASTILHGEKAANENLDHLINIAKRIKTNSNELCSQVFSACQSIGVQYKSILANKRDDLMEFQSNLVCRGLLDFIDGNKLSEENQAAINETLQKVGQIEHRILHTEKDVEHITKTVKRQELHINNIGDRINAVDERVDDLSQQVESHTREIERIDAKTLSYVPSEWGHVVCKSLNVRADNDWRLLGKRFGYSTSELKHWAMQSDPSMSLLNEWYMTHKADEATYGLVKMLNEIGRKDVEHIIRKSVETAGNLIPDDLPMEIKRLPPVFLSYQWGSQQSVLKLKENLEQAGYACWMDLGQMGGGDKLFSKIDSGIRGAKVVVCCINKSYSQSDNCSREVHLAISTGKQLIPLQMEKLTWPPEGALGPIMSEYLYIRFYDRKANDPNYWPADKFTELLGQIRYVVAPDPDMITDQYRNWFVPRIDNLIFLQPTTNATNATVANNTPLVITHPQIFISYQWDYQKDVVVLYEKLTKMGYACWLDIFQMGGGDSLFEKIDTGIRHAKCILSCVTPNYTKSINCRREMALSDALKKPILPLLLEETSTWPPDGPMSMVFAEKPYIDFRRVYDDNKRWVGKEFQAVLAKLEQLIPEVQPEKPERHIFTMQRPTTAIKRTEQSLMRIRSAPSTPSSRTCLLM